MSGWVCEWVGEREIYGVSLSDLHLMYDNNVYIKLTCYIAHNIDTII